MLLLCLLVCSVVCVCGVLFCVLAFCCVCWCALLFDAVLLCGDWLCVCYVVFGACALSGFV